MSVYQLILLGVLLALAVLYAVKRGTGSLTLGGVVMALSVGAMLLIFGGLSTVALLLLFFLSSSSLSAFGKRIKRPVEIRLYNKVGRRDAVQVLSNSAAAICMTLLSFVTGKDIFLLAGFAAFAECNADTWASEIGMLSKRDPLSLLTFQRGPRGLSGGVTLLGLGASFSGAFLIAGAYGLLDTGRVPASMLLLNMALITVAGFIGALFDSVLGALCQAKYRSHKTGELTEKPQENGQMNALVRGNRHVTNDLVNGVSSLVSAVLLLVLKRMIGQ